jgi:hypothetical protein
MRLIELAAILTLSLILAPLGATAQPTFSGSCQAIFP